MAEELTKKQVDLETALQILGGSGQMDAAGAESSAQADFERKFTVTIDPNLDGRIVSLLMEENTPAIR